MKKTIINGVEFSNFGENNYSCGMELITTTASIIPQQVLNGEFPGVYLNPSAPWTSEECFCVLGTPEQYKEFYQTQKDAQISKRLIEQGGLGVSITVYRELRNQIEEDYKNWWE